MTLNEPEKQQSDGGGEEPAKRAASDSGEPSSETTAAREVVENQENEMDWTDSEDSVKNPLPAAKRTFDQISDGQTKKDSEEANDQQQQSTQSTSDNCESNAAFDESKQKAEPDSEKDASISESVTFNVVYAKEKFEITFDLNESVGKLKEHLQRLTSVVTSSQKLCYKGNLTDNKTLKECSIKDGVKVLMIGSKTNEIAAVISVTKDSLVKETKEPPTVKEPLCQQKPHKKIIDKGLPEQVMAGWTNDDCTLPLEPLTGMLNKYGNKVRLTFKLEQDEVWISTKERTQKIKMTSIKSVISEPIDNHPQYHIMGLQIGPTEASRIWFYWVPAQYIRAIKNVILDS